MAAMLTAALVVEGAVKTSAQEATQDSARSVDRQPGSAGEASRREATAPWAAVGIGDRLKITFFESLDVGSRPVAGERDTVALQTFYQRMDLTGEYAVDQDGAISFPKLGRFTLEGRSLQEVQSELAVAFTRSMGRPADVNVTILERPPVYVVGPVKQPGAYKFVPGMMVLQAVALAGGLEQGVGGTSQMIEGIREMERLRKTSDNMMRLLARRARLDAERNGLPLLKTPEQLIGLTGENTLSNYVETENAVLRVEQSQKQQQLNEVNLSIQLARNEIQALKNKLFQADVQRNIRQERLDDIQKLMSRGMTTRANQINVRSEVADAEARRQDVLFAIVIAEGRLALAEQVKARVVTDNAANVLRAIATTDGEIVDLRQSLASTEMVASLVADSTARLQFTRTSTAPAYEIVRRTRTGTTTQQVQETSSLLPGDVLKIKLTVTPAEPRAIGVGPGRQTSLQRPFQTLR